MSLENKTFNELITFTRATGGGRFNAAGQYELLPANEPRIDYDPVTKACRGILIEEQRTNLLLRSSEFDNASWLKLRVSVSANSAVAPDGTTTADKLVEDYSALATHQIGSASSFSAGVSYSVSVFVKAGERASFGMSFNGAAFSEIHRISFNLNNKAILVRQGNPTFSVSDVGGGWHRVSLTAPAVASGISKVIFYIQDDLDGVSYAGDGTSGIYIWGAQLEVGAFPTSYIPTTTAQATRAADVCSVDNLSPWYRADEGTLFADFVAGVDTRGNVVTNLQGNISESDVIRLRMNSAGILDGAIIVGGVSLANNSLLATTANTQNKAAVTFKVGSSRAAVNGAFSNNTTPSALPAVSQLSIGDQIPSGNAINGHIRRIRYIPRRISDTELQALTAL